MVAIALPLLFSLVFALTPYAAPAAEDRRIADIRAALLSTGDAPTHPLAARDDPPGARALDLSLDKFHVAHQIGSSAIDYWAQTGGEGSQLVHLALDGTNHTMEMLQYYMFKQEGDWPPTTLGWSKDTGAAGLLKAAEGTGVIEKTVKCALSVKAGKEGLPSAHIQSQWKLTNPWFKAGSDGFSTVDRIICIEDW